MKEEPIVYEGTVLPEWIDYNGHLNDACYVIVFSQAIDNFMIRLGMDENFRSQRQVSLYTMQTAVHYLQEIGKSEPLQVSAHLLEYDSKKMRLFLTMRHPVEETRLATMEALLLNIDMSVRRASPFQAETLDKIATLATSQRDNAWPPEAGKGVSLRKAH